MTEEKRTIRGVEVVFPCKPYPSQFSFMDKVIQGIEKKQNCLLESPTGSGKSLALLCSALAWQTAEYNKKRQEDLQSPGGIECCCNQKNVEEENGCNQQDVDKCHPVQPSHISISVVKGQIAHQQVDVIVNTTSANLQLNYGAVSQSLLCVGGPGLQKECKQKYPNGVQPGDIAETSGGNLKCDIVCHGALLPWKESGALDALQKFFSNCLTTANDKGYKSIAFPALGTGNLGYPRDVVAREMFTNVDLFAKNNPSSALVDVRFVIYGGDRNSVKVFEELQTERLNGNKKWLEHQTPVSPEKRATSPILIPESDDDDDDDFKPSAKFRTPGGSAQPISNKIRNHQSISYDTSPSAGTSTVADGCGTCGAANKSQSRKVPKIYFGTRTHKQISQIVRELKKTAYREARMTILASREHTCIHPEISKSKHKNEGCKELMDGPGCKFNDRVKKIFPHYSNLQELGLSEAWDIEDLVDVCKTKKTCAYFSVRSFRKEADIIFCPYNYLIDPVIRQNMEISLKDEIIIVDEAHNIEDSAREGASDLFTDEQLDKAYKEIHEMVVHEIKPVEHLRLNQMVEGFMKLIQNNMDQLEQKDYDQAAKVWSGYDIVVRMKEYGIGPEHKDHLMKCFSVVCEDMMEKTVKNVRGHTVKLSSATLSTIEHMFKIMDYMYRDNLKFVEDYRVAILRSTSYVTDKNTDGSWISSRNKRGGMRNMPKYIITLHFWCMNPGVAFSDFTAARCVVLTSGTLSPMNSFESELGAPFPIKLEANHVIEDKQVWVGAMSQGPTGKPLHAVYKTMETLDFQDELGRTVLQVCQEVPHGVLCFLPSYRSLEKFVERWKTSGIYSQISEIKKIIQEPRKSDQVDFDELMRYFYDTIHGVNDDDNETGEEVTGALFLAVCRGKVSEGLDFADNFARAVITVGIPYPNWKDIQVGQKRMYNDKYKNSRGLLSGGEWYEIQAFRALNQALGRCIRHRKDWGLLILADERFVKNRDKYCKGLSKWVRNKVQGFTSCKDAMESISTFSKQRMKDMPVVNPDTSFIPGTPVTPGQSLSRRQSLHGAAAFATPITPSYAKGSPGTPSYPDTNLSKTMLFSSPQPGALPQPQFSSPETSKTIGKGTEDTPRHILLSPTEVKKSAVLTEAAKTGNVIQAQPGQQTQVVFKNPQQTMNTSQQLINNFLSTTNYQYVLSVMNSPLVPKDKPYYIIIDEGKPNQQMILVQPNQRTSSNEQILGNQLQPAVPNQVNQQTLQVQPNQRISSNGQLIGNQLQPAVSYQVIQETQPTETSMTGNRGLVSLLNGCQSAVKSVNDGHITGKFGKIDSKPEAKINFPAGNQKMIQNKLFKYCNIPETASDKETADCKTVQTANCPKTPIMFDTQDSEKDVQSEETKMQISPVKNGISSNVAPPVGQVLVKDKGEKKKPIFRRHSVAPTITIDNDSPDDFKVNTQTRRKSCDKKILTEIQQNTTKDKIDEEEDEENHSEEILKVRRRNRGAKRKSNTNLRSVNKKPKGVDFLDNIEDTKNTSKEKGIYCKSCQKCLIIQTEELEKRRRYPGFVKMITSQRNAEVVFIPHFDVHKSSVQAVSTEVKPDLTLNSYVDKATGCVLQYLCCQSCIDDVIGIQVISKGKDAKDIEECQAWFISSHVVLENGNT